MDNKYLTFIKTIAYNHFHGIMFNIDITEEERKTILDYAKQNKEKIEELLSQIGYHVYITCTNYDAYKEVISMIEGKPYYEYIANERNDEKTIKICYHENLLKSLVFDEHQFIYGEYYDIIFNVSNGKIKCHDNKKIKFIPMNTTKTSSNYVTIYYNVLVQ